MEPAGTDGMKSEIGWTYGGRAENTSNNNPSAPPRQTARKRHIPQERGLGESLHQMLQFKRIRLTNPSNAQLEGISSRRRIPAHLMFPNDAGPTAKPRFLIFRVRMDSSCNDTLAYRSAILLRTSPRADNSTLQELRVPKEHGFTSLKCRFSVVEHFTNQSCSMLHPDGSFLLTEFTAFPGPLGRGSAAILPTCFALPLQKAPFGHVRTAPRFQHDGFWCSIFLCVEARRQISTGVSTDWQALPRAPGNVVTVLWPPVDAGYGYMEKTHSVGVCLPVLKMWPATHVLDIFLVPTTCELWMEHFLALLLLCFHFSAHSALAAWFVGSIRTGRGAGHGREKSEVENGAVA
ncbi:hypothetical protein DFH09DRAFT_1082608 [Mycena vulgaris]|nr:hypothetical protein DFH09DRAFT_1082608 [Mycena vulgaris]